MKAHLHYFLNLGVDLIPPRLTCQATYRPKKKKEEKRTSSFHLTPVDGRAKETQKR
jgi:hypothetical protein